MCIRIAVVVIAGGVYDDVQILCTVPNTSCHLADVAGTVAFQEYIVDVCVMDIDALFVAGGCDPEPELRRNAAAV